MTTSSQVAVVTGGAQGIGGAVAERIAAEGHPVAVLDLDAVRCASTVQSIESAGGRAIAVGADITDATAVDTAIAEVRERLGPPTILVNNAGITADNLLFKMSEDEWDTVIAVHLRGAFLMSRAVQRHMTEQSWGRIVNLSSVAALGNRGQVNYSAAKAGIQGLTKTMAIELGRYNVTVNAIAPGFIVTEMTKATAERIGMSFEAFQSQAAERIPVGRVGLPADVAAAAAFFIHPENSFVTGQVLYVAGGPRA